MAIPIPGDVRHLLGALNYVHLSTLRADGSPRNWVVRVGLENDHILVYNPNRLTDAADHAPSYTPSASELPGAHRGMSHERGEDGREQH